MSEQEKNTGSSAAGGSVVMVEQTKGSHHKTPYRPNELQEDTDAHHKRSTAPAVPSVAEKLKEVPEDSMENEVVELKEHKESEPTMSFEKQKQSIAKKISSSAKRREHSPESFAMTPIETGIKKGMVVHPSQPIPTEVQPAVPATLDVVAAEKDAAKKADDDSITEEITDMRSPEVAKEHSEWSDDEEAGGLPRSDSRGSKVSRAVRQLFCCGVSYEAPSEENISTHRLPYSHGI